MYCSTCGAHVPSGRTHCSTCGAVVAAAPTSPRMPAAPMPPMAPSGPLARHQPMGRMQAAAGHTCPRCGYTGEGVSYFSKGSHIAGLIVLGTISAGMMGLFAIIYYLTQRNNVICPRCAKNWGSTTDLMLSPRSGGAVAGHTGHTPLPSGSGTAAHVWSIVMFVVAALFLVGGIVGLELGPALFGMAAGAGGLALQSVARKQKEARRAALISNLQLPVLSLAAQRQGRLTVTETAAALGWTLPRAEKVLNSLDDGIRVNSEVTDEGVIVYEFLELHDQGRLPYRRALEG